MKYVTYLFSCFFITGCATVYTGTDSEKVAYVSVPQSSSDYKLLGGFSGKNVAIGDINNSGCMVNTAKINAESLDDNQKLVVPAGREIGLSVSAYQGNTTCGLGLAVMLEEGQNYVLNFGQGSTLCGLGISKVTEGNEVLPVSGAKLKPGFSKLCKQ